MSKEACLKSKRSIPIFDSLNDVSEPDSASTEIYTLSHVLAFNRIVSTEFCLSYVPTLPTETLEERAIQKVPVC